MELKEILNKMKAFNGPWRPRGRVRIDSANCFGSTPLHIAVLWGDIDAVSKLIEAGAEISKRGEDGMTPLHMAVGGSKQVFEFLLRSGADVHIRDDSGRTALELARGMREAGAIELIQQFYHE